MTTAKKPSKKAIKKLQDDRDARNVALREASITREDGPTPVEVPAAPVPPPPAAPSPVVIQMQEQILELVNRRMADMNAVASANAALRRAEADAKSMQERLMFSEQEIQYRLGIIAQLEGKPAMQGWGSAPAYPGTPQPSYADVQARVVSPGVEYGGGAALAQFASVPQQGIGSVPANRASTGGDVDDIRSESAEEVRRSM